MKSARFTLGLIAFLLAQAPPNDNCQNALQLNIGGCRTGQTTQNATTQTGEPGSGTGGCVGSGAGCNATQTVWYYFQAGPNDSVLRITVDRTNSANCAGGLVVYGPFTSLPNCFSFNNSNQVWCQSSLIGGNLGESGSNSAYYLDLPVQPNRYYMVQVWGRSGGGPNDPFMNFDICLQRACDHCGNPCLSGVCNYPFNTAPSVTWVTNNCASIPQNPPADHLSDLQHCFSFTAVNTTMYLGGVISSTCSGGNVTSLTWTLYNSSCTRISGPTDFFSNSTMTGLIVGQTYRVCYRYEVASGCAHSAFYPYTYAAPLPVTAGELPGYVCGWAGLYPVGDSRGGRPRGLFSGAGPTRPHRLRARRVHQTPPDRRPQVV